VRAEIHPIGHIETPYKKLEDCPRNINPSGPACALVLDPPYDSALFGLNPGDRIMVLYWFDGVDRERLMQPRRGEGPVLGTFALRSPHRPNPIAVAVVEIETIDGNRVSVPGLDCLDGTPLLDIKPAAKAEKELR
jgi:tRNA-Thr(GGU) m(6)t(6)A37 methyltransferase TsaA